MMFAKIIWRECKNNKSFTLLFIFTLSLGLCGFMALESFKQSVSYTIREKSKAILGADLALSARREISQKEQDLVMKLAPQAKSSLGIEVFSMIARKNGRSLLAQIKAVEKNFPFYGTLELDKTSQPFSPGNPNDVWVYPEILLQLGLKTGDPLQIGEKSFKIAGVISNDPSAGFSTSMAPRVYIAMGDLKGTGLIREGSLARYSIAYKIPNISLEKLRTIRDEVFKSATESDLQVVTHENSSEQLGRLLGYLNDFLGLTSLIALFLSAIGTGFLAYSFLRQKTRDMAILISLGLPHRKTFLLFLIHIGVLGLLSSLLAIIFSLSLFPFLNNLTRGLLPFNIELRIDSLTLMISVFAGMIGSLFILLPLLLQMRRLRPALLFSNQRDGAQRWDLWSAMGVLPSLGVFLALSVFQTHSYKIGFIFFTSFLGAGLALFAISYSFLFVLGKYPLQRPLSAAWALRDISRHRLVTIIGFLTLGLGVMMMNIVPQVQASLQEELKSPEHSKVPSLFLFDIQEDQVTPLKNLLVKNQVTLNDLSPLVRSRLIEINGKAFDKGEGAKDNGKSPEERQEAAFRNRGFNLSYRQDLKSSETLVDGKLFSAHAGNEAEISMEKNFADRLNIHIGDTLTFDIQSIPISGHVINLRKVQWTSFQPNFFVVFQPGFLEDAPKTFLATLPSLPIDKKIDLQNQIVNQLSNISLVDVSRTMERISEIIKQMSWALQFMSLLNVLVGLVVLYSLAHHQAQARQMDIGLLKALGAPFKYIENSFVIQFLAMALAAGVTGVLGSFIVSYLLSALLFENVWVFDATAPIVILIVTILSAAVVTSLAIRKSLRVSPQKLLSEDPF
jgi:putative ABC transport system permease protein